MGRRYGDIRMNPKGMVIFPNYVTTDKLEHWDMVDVNPFSESASQKFPLGTLLIWGDKKFRYVRAGGTALGYGVPVQGPATLHADADDDLAVAVSGAIGDTTLSITGTTNLSSTANIYAEGYVYVNTKTAGAFTARIKSHPALNAASTKVLTLYDPLPVAVTAATDAVGLCKSPYDGVIAVAATLTNACVGVPVLDGTANYYTWIQSGGPCAVLCNTTCALGTMVVVGTSAGEVDPMAAVTTEQIIGTPIIVGAADKNTMVMLTLD